MQPILALFRRYSWILGDVFYSLLILAGAWIAAKILDRLLRKFIHPTSETNSHLKHYLLQALRIPVFYLVFLISIYAVLHRLPLSRRPYVYLDGILFVLGVAIVVFMVIRLFSATLQWYQHKMRAQTDATLELEFLPLIDRLLMVLVFLIGIGIIFDHFRIDVKSLLVTLGIGSLAIGLALQDTLANMFGGLTILLDRPFRVGHFIELTTGESGHVVRIGVRATQLYNADNNLLSIPNSLLVKNMITNYSLPDIRLGVKTRVTVAVGTNLEQVKEILRQAAVAVEDVLSEPPPEILLQDMSDSGLTLLVQVAVKDYRNKLRSLDKLNQSLYLALQAANISLAPGWRALYTKNEEPEKAKGRNII